MSQLHLSPFSACGGSDDPNESPTTSAASAEDTATQDVSEDESTSDADAEEDSTDAETSSEETAEEQSAAPAFGEAVPVSENLTVTISEPEEFTPSDTSFFSEDWDAFVKMDVVAENTGDEPLEAMSVYTRATTGSKEAEQVFDTEGGIDMPTAVIQPGKTLEFTIGYGVITGEDFVLTVEDMMDFSGNAVTLETSIG